MAFSTEEKVEAEDEALPMAVAGGGDWCDVSHEEWRRRGTSSPLPAAVAGVIHELLEMEARIWDSTETVRISAKFVHFG